MSLDILGSPHTYWGHGTNLEYPCHLAMPRIITWILVLIQIILLMAPFTGSLHLHIVFVFVLLNECSSL
uniref:Uncharacterized protein n=1 Tax=Brassica oleracea TaxID=3712 RepID=A0A3P6FUH3_BRAOL|nr:unnamed protein product [Brassica oleracea]